jgi:signal transduction histidine kinase
MKRNSIVVTYVLAYIACVFVFLMNYSLAHSLEVGNERYIRETSGAFAVSAFSVVAIYAVLVFCNLMSRHYNAIAFNSILAAALLSMHFRTVSTILMAIILVAGLMTTLILVYLNNNNSDHLN